jgi:hypothetical protein
MMMIICRFIDLLSSQPITGRVNCGRIGPSFLKKVIERNDAGRLRHCRSCILGNHGIGILGVERSYFCGHMVI